MLEKGIDKSLLPGREKYWDEKTADEKIELLGRQVEILSSQIQSYAREIDEMRRHHHVNGKMLFEQNRGTEQIAAFRQYGGPLNRGKDK